MKPVFNLITRTSGRPNYFNECNDSVVNQRYPKSLIRHYVTFDREEDLHYIEKCNDLTVIEVQPTRRENPNHLPYNLYLNDVLKYMVDEKEEGWIVILNDDCRLANEDSLEKLSSQLTDPNQLYIIRCQKEGRIIPGDARFGQSVVVGDFDLACLCFHTTRISDVKFEAKLSSENTVVNQLTSSKPAIWINQVVVVADQKGDGLRNDHQSVRKKITLKPVQNVRTSIIDTDTDVKEIQIETIPEEGDEGEDEEVQADLKAQADLPVQADLKADNDEEEIIVTEPLVKIPAHSPTQTKLPAPKKLPQLVQPPQLPQLPQLPQRPQPGVSENKFYLLDEGCMRRLAETMAALIGAPEITDKLSRALETKNLKDTLGAVLPMPQVPKGKKASPIEPVTKEAPSMIDHIYLITDNQTEQNKILLRNQGILDQSEYKYTVLTTRDLNLYSYQQLVVEALNNATQNNYGSVAIINGNYMFHAKFAQILSNQLKRIKPFKLWYLGGLSIKAKDIRSKFNRDDYLLLNDDLRQAQLNEDRLLKHWRSYGIREGRTSHIELYPSPAKYQSTDIHYGFVLPSSSYSAIIEQISRISNRNTRNVINDYAEKSNSVIYSHPDLAIPPVKLEPGNKNKKIIDSTIKNGWYLSSYI